MNIATTPSTSPYFMANPINHDQYAKQDIVTMYQAQSVEIVYSGRLLFCERDGLCYEFFKDGRLRQVFAYKLI